MKLSSVLMSRGSLKTTIVLSLGLCLSTLFAICAQGQTTLANGASQAGTLTANTTNSYMFAANQGDSFVLRLGTVGFRGKFELYGPTGTFLGTFFNGTDAELAYTATNSGTFTTLVSSFDLGGAGTYVLHLAQFPEPFIVPAGDEGGPMTNGGNYAGTNSLGDLDMWSFSANTGDNIVLRLGTVGFRGILRLYGPTGALLSTAFFGTDAELAYTATNSGTFTALVGSYDSGGVGTYVLHLAQFPESFIVPAGDEGGPMTNGVTYTGTNSLGDLDMWSFSANTGDNIVLRLGTVGFRGILRLYGPTGALLSTSFNGTDAELAYTATNSGTFTALVGSYDSGGVGTYVLHLAQFPEPFILSAGDQGGPMVNGGNHAGTNSLGDLDMWSFSANTGDNIVLRLGTVGFRGILRLYGPTGALLSTAFSGTDAELAYTATNNGTFTALVASFDSGGVGTYVLHLAQFPEPFIVPGGDEGGSITNGGAYAGTNSLGDLDMWSFSANTGDNIVLRLATASYRGTLRLYGPTGALLSTAFNGTDAELTYTATNSGTFTALTSSFDSGGVGTYVLRLAQFPEPFIVSANNGGGPMTGTGSYFGTNTVGDLVMWAFTACVGNPVNLVVYPTNFTATVNLYGPSGVLLRTASSAGAAAISYTTTNSGTFAVLLTSYFSGGVGTYQLADNGLSDGLKLCPPAISGTNGSLGGVGGVPAATFVLFTQTNVSEPFGLWGPILTNQFNAFGVFSYTNLFNPAEPQRYFRLEVP